jgi:hypothetical protein
MKLVDCRNREQVWFQTTCQVAHHMRNQIRDHEIMHQIRSQVSYDVRDQAENPFQTQIYNNIVIYIKEEINEIG